VPATPRLPRHSRRLAAVPAVTAAAAPVLAAGPAPASPLRDPGVANTSTQAAGPPVTVRLVDHGFDWGAAGVGAGTAAALALLGVAGMQARTRAGTHNLAG
jgi:hypothetical protein